jgi:hypothetical protein
MAVARDGTLLVRQIPWSEETQTVTGQSSDLAVLPAGAAALKPLFGATPALETNAELSPDETLVAYQSDEVDGRAEVWVRSYPNVHGSKQRVTYTGGTRPLWSRTGQELFYESNGALMGVPVTAGPTFGNPRMILEPKYFLTNLGEAAVFGGATGRTYDISLDGARFLVLKNLPAAGEPPASRARMVVVQDWFDELRTRVPAR